MKILIIVPEWRNCGPINVVKSLVVEYKRLGILVEVMSLGNKNQSIYCSDTKVNITVVCRRKIISAIYNKIINEKIDIIHSHGFFPDFYNSIFTIFFKSKFFSISTVHNFPGKDYSLEFGSVIGFILAKIHYFILRRIKKIIGCSCTVTNYLKSKGVDSEPIRNGVPLPNKNNKKINKNNVFNILILGRLIKRKNPLEIIKALPKINNQCNIKITYAGDGEYLEIIKNKNIPEIITLVFVNDPQNMIDTADLIFSSSLAEGFPLSILEAIVRRKKVLLSNIEPHLECYNYFEHGVDVYDLGDINDLSEKLVNSLKLNDIPSDKDVYLASSQRMANEYIKCYKDNYKNG